MAFMKVVIFIALLAVSYAAPGYEINSYGHYGPVAAIAHAPTVSYSHAPTVSYSHAPTLSYSHAPTLSYSHAPAIAHAPVELEHHAPANYEFSYGVKDGHTHDIKEQAEKRVGDKVDGYYSLVEPDGTTRTVHYTADDHNGFNAVVSKSGHEVHPATAVNAAAVGLSYPKATPLVTYPAVPSYSHVAPAVSYSNALGHGYSAGGLGHGPSLGHGYGGYH
ncbi:cuticle protein 7-like [Zootermopsis nevadensis]|uniref:Adult-specific cuticular protein ACP-20 n=1 Tax=Zootermopsis nevadensis TaxID=136037 RepID=A0A067RJU6_ZOONE|nr:cuticle protein 7-like [Zootermopsis nevadensis]KDR20840.1 Adult-specific cuticular protein ACP-20 [Zootermopsis nevadensis]